MADIADAVNHDTGTAFFDIISATNSGKDDVFLLAWFWNSKPAIGFSGDLFLYHVDIAVTMGIMTVPAEFTPPPDSLLRISAIVLVAKVSC